MQHRFEVPRRGVEKCFCLTSSLIGRVIWGCNANLLPEPLRYTVIPFGKTVKRRREETVIHAECGVSALVHATTGATASRFAGRSSNRTTPITRNTITSVKFLWTLCIQASTV